MSTRFIVLLLALLAPLAPALAQQLFEGSVGEESLWLRPGDGCSAEGGGTATYHQTAFVTYLSGRYAFSMDFEGGDGVLLVYDGSFEPAMPDRNCIAVAGSSGAGRLPARVELDLVDNRRYVLVASSVDPAGDPTYLLSTEGPGTIHLLPDERLDLLAGQAWRFAFLNDQPGFASRREADYLFTDPRPGSDGRPVLDVIDEAGVVAGTVRFNPIHGHQALIEVPRLQFGPDNQAVELRTDSGYVGRGQQIGRYRSISVFSSARELTDSPAGYWPLDHVRDGVVSDAAGRRLALATDVAAFESPPRPGNTSFQPRSGLTLLGRGGIDFGSDLALSGSTDFTISVWVRVLGGPEDQSVIAQRDAFSVASRGEYWVRVTGTPFPARPRPDGVVEFVINGGEGSQFPDGVLYGTTRVDDGAWHHLVLGRVGATGFIYVDGRLDAMASGQLVSLEPDWQVAMGTDPRDATVTLFGDLARLRLFDFWIGEEEIRCLFGTGEFCGVLFTEPSGSLGEGRFEAEPMNRRPTATDDRYQLRSGEALDANILQNDGDPDGDALSVSDQLPARVPGLTIADDGALRFEGSAATQAVVSAVYEVSDGRRIDRGTIEIEILGDLPPPAPTVIDAFYAYLCEAFGRSCDRGG